MIQLHWMVHHYENKIKIVLQAITCMQVSKIGTDIIQQFYKYILYKATICGIVQGPIASTTNIVHIIHRDK